MNKMAKSKKAIEELTPKVEIDNSGEVNYIMKDKFFDKSKIYIDKVSKKENSVDVDWKRLVLGGYSLILFKGKPLTKKQLGAFNDAAKEYFLEEFKADNKAVVIESIPESND